MKFNDFPAAVKIVIYEDYFLTVYSIGKEIVNQRLSGRLVDICKGTKVNKKRLTAKCFSKEFLDNGCSR